MPLVSLKELLKPAREKHYAVPAINVGSYESVCAVFEAAEAEQAPVIIQFFKRLVDHGHAEHFAPMIRHMAECTSAPICLHLDHGDTVAQVVQCIRFGFSSVMIDASMSAFAENVALARKVAELAHSAGVPVEAELGYVPFGDHDSIEAGLTNPSEAADFVNQTGIDALAVAVGTAHGMYKKTPSLDFDRLEKIAAVVDIPLVLHGGSGTPSESLRKCIDLGVTKINIATEFQSLILKEAETQLRQLDGRFLPIDVFMEPVVTKLVEFVRAKMCLFGASGQAT